MTPEAQRDIEIDRAIEGRCPKCGSIRANAGNSVWVLYDGAMRDVGIFCLACKYWHDGERVRQDRPFIAPGERGSHDPARAAVEG